MAAGGLKTDIDALMFYGFCALMFLVPVATSPAVIIGSAVIALWIFSGKFLKDTSWLRQDWIWPVLAVMALHFIGLLYTQDLKMGLSYAKKTHYWLFAFAVTGVLITRARADVLMKSYIAGVSFTSFVFLLQSAGLVPMRPPYSVGLLNKWAHISFSLLSTFGMLVIAGYFGKSAGSKEKALWLGLFAINFFALFILKSDSGHMAFILLSPLMAYAFMGGRKAGKITLVSGLLVAGLLVSPVSQSRLKEVFSGTEAYKKGEVVTPVGMRYYMWTGAVKIYLDNPIFGIGTGAYQSEMLRRRTSPDVPETAQPHNSFLYMAVSFGIPGLAAILWLFWRVLKEGWRRRDAMLGYCVLAFTLVLIIGSLTDTQILQVHTATLFAVFTGLSGRDLPDG